MAELFGLSGERAGPAFAEPSVHQAGNPAGHSERKPVLFHRRVASRILRIEQVVRDGFELPVLPTQARDILVLVANLRSCRGVV
jgi:hypothetical protein